ncbi:MAG: T9SS type A sorting domain-containing protein, partial [Prolixibacteraceae bacterium]|nr:T9SS type A sorting domain-containing protein [Prolixibacteraceae bacterium]
NSIDEHGIYVSNSSHRPIVRYNECWGNNNIGIHMNGDLSMGGDGIISDAQIYGNYLHDNNLAAGINLDGALNPVIYNNLIVNNHSAQGIALFQMNGAIVTHGAKIYNNTIVVPDDGRWGILLDDGAQVNTEIYNNIIVTNHSWRGCISAENTTGLKSDYNILSNSMSNAGDGSSISFSEWQGLGFDQHSILSGNFDDLFTDYANRDFSIPSSSIAVNAGNGQLVSALVERDFINESRPSGGEYDIGAYEYSFPISSKVNEEGSIEVYPNPAACTIFVKSITGDYRFELYTISGQVVRKGKSEQGMPISIEGLSSGTCILKLLTSEGIVYYSKFTVSNIR